MDLGDAIARVPDSLFRSSDTRQRTPPLVANSNAALFDAFQRLDITRRGTYFSIGTGYQRQPLVAAMLGLDVVIADLDSSAIAMQRSVAEHLSVRPTFLEGDIIECPSYALAPYLGRMGVVECLNSTHQDDFVDGAPWLMLQLVADGGVLYANATGPYPPQYDKLVRGFLAVAPQLGIRLTLASSGVFTTPNYGNDAKILEVIKIQSPATVAPSLVNT
ncbi:MAG: hypothetical protein Q7S65_02795 [Nanoarchaeota archaeon]|nr:hypothetical protein [Nanoarchaeota archaeon]